MDINADSPEESRHPGGVQKFWRDEKVQKYDAQQSLLSEKKAEALAAITRVLSYFCKLNSLTELTILDIGCGPGTPQTLSAHLLRAMPNSKVIGVDASDQMVDTAITNLVPEYGQRFIGYMGDFNSNNFWGRLEDSYDFIASSGALHYLSDARRVPFLTEAYKHLRPGGVFVAGIGDCAAVPEIAEMEQLFRAEYTFGKLQVGNKSTSFNEFRKRFQENDNKANINWKSPSAWLESMRSAGFKADIVWHLWVRSIIVGIK